MALLGGVTPRGAMEAYMDVSPMAAWDRDVWDHYDTEIDIAFHGADVFLTPLVNWVRMPDGADTWHTGTEVLGSHVNHNTIGDRQRFIKAMYVDMRRRKLTTGGRYAGKVQVHKFDELNSRYSRGTPRFFLQILRERMLNGIVQTHEKIARDMIMEYALFKFLGDGTAFELGTADFSDITATSTYQVGLKFVDDVKLRLIERSRKWRLQPTNYSNPVPDSADALVMTTPNVIHDLWTSEEGDWVQELRQRTDERLINGGVFSYKGMTFVDNDQVRLYNAGILNKQVAVTEPIHWGDGAPHPDNDDPLDLVYYAGQGDVDLKHYVQCTAFSASDYIKGQRVSIHIARTTAWGITDGVDFLDGKTYENEVYEVDAGNNRLVFYEPFVEDYTDAFIAVPNGGSETTCYAFVTSARDIHPIMIMAARGVATFCARTGVEIYDNLPDDADLPGVTRMSWDEYGGKNPWNPFVYDLLFCAASDTLSGRAATALR